MKRTLYDLENPNVPPKYEAAPPGEETTMIVRRDALDRLDNAALIDSTLTDD